MNNEPSASESKVCATLLALESLRSNDKARAMEVLEIDLDASVLALKRIAKEIPDDRREEVNAILRRIRDYRHAYPRRIEADLSGVAKGLLVRAGRLGGERVSKILDEVE